MIFPAQKNGGQIDLLVNCMVREVTTDDEGRATGVSYINKEDRKEYKLRGKVVVLGASACSSARILLNSKSKQHPNGLGNSSDVVGKYLHDSTGADRAGFIPDLMNRKVSYNEDGVGGMHVYSHGGETTLSWIFQGVTTLKCGAVWECRATDLDLMPMSSTSSLVPRLVAMVMYCGVMPRNITVP